MTGTTGPLTFREMLAGKRFGCGAELVTTRGFVTPDQPNRLAALGEQLAHDPRIDWVSITDSPGGNTMLPPDWLGRLLPADRGRIVLHLTCKDQNRNGLESTAWKYAAEGFNSIVAMTGDFPRSGFGGGAAPVFDLDSVSLIAMLRAMNAGLQVPGRQGQTNVLAKTNFLIGCVASPFKRHERELMPQYFKLLRKISAGAQFVYTQLGYDMRKFHEVKLLLASHGLNIPVIGNVYALNKAVADLFHRKQIPGCVLTDKLMELVTKYSGGPDKGRGFFIELAAKQLAVFKGLGFAGGYLGGISKAETFFEIIDKANSYGASDWKVFAREIQFSQEGEFYLFEQDAATGLGEVEHINREYLESLKRPAKSRHVTVGYRLSRFLHDKVFTPGTPGFNFMKRIYSRWDQKPTALPNAAHALERMSKFVWFGCRDCGDCSLPDCGYLCPLVSCSKGARNGPCGGSCEGNCETGDKECIWARAYERLKCFGEAEEMLNGPPVFYNAGLKGTSSWANTFLGRDHYHAGNSGELEPPPESNKDSNK